MKRKTELKRGVKIRSWKSSNHWIPSDPAPSVFNYVERFFIFTEANKGHCKLFISIIGTVRDRNGDNRWLGGVQGFSYPTFSVESLMGRFCSVLDSNSQPVDRKTRSQRINNDETSEYCERASLINAPKYFHPLKYGIIFCQVFRVFQINSEIWPENRWIISSRVKIPWKNVSSSVIPCRIFVISILQIDRGWPLMPLVLLYLGVRMSRARKS